LPLREGSILVVDASDNAVRSGQTNPTDLLKLHNRGVRIHSISNLHAKVFVFGNTAVVASSNASKRSRDVLIECGVVSKEPSVVKACRKFVDSLLGAALGPETLRRLKGIYRPPKFEGQNTQRSTAQRIDRGSLWVVHLSRVDVPDRDVKVAEREEPKARAEIKDRRRFEVDEFFWDARGLHGLAKGHSLVMIVRENDGRCFVSPLGRVLRIKRYVTRDGNRTVVFLEQPRNVRRKQLSVLKRRLSRRSVAMLNKIKSAQIVRDRELADVLFTLWA
jgi:hypothetical protein